ncbi:MAG: DUF1501 domain-containing protein [Allorhizobium sp.]
MASISLSRRAFITSACCVAAAPLVTPMSFAAMPGDNRFVMIVLRGAMDGLELVQPYGEARFQNLRPGLALSPDTGLIDLDGFFGLNPAASGLVLLWQSGELSFVNAVSTPYRDQRSHFDGQDMLETGGGHVSEEKNGWLNRALSTMPSESTRRAIDVSSSTELILSGPNVVDVWASDSDLAMGADDMGALTRLYAQDPAFARALEEAVRADKFSDMTYGTAKRASQIKDVASLAAGMLLKEYRIASFSITGWDTHADQAGQFRKPATDLSQAIVTLKSALGPQAWEKTVVLAVTEFGRTVRQNGSGGTDHGTGGLALLAGGAIPGRRVFGKWPGLGEGALLDDRDLQPTGDVREVAAAMLYRQFGISAADLTGQVFPGLVFDKRSELLRA